jgi:hypothetical protein
VYGFCWMTLIHRGLRLANGIVSVEALTSIVLESPGIIKVLFKSAATPAAPDALFCPAEFQLC